ncbi:MAG TPA: hypothetical protein VJN18_29285 [Polyangiaceae bacterium]|nr:hypothetical protein [Polyangiaceae bacterium]
MQVVDFYSLERSLQDRFVEAANGSVPPKPMAFTPARPRPLVLAWWGGCVLTAGVLIALLAAGFGSLESSMALLGVVWAVVLAVLVALAVFAALRALSLDHDRDGLPYRAGIYLFPIGVVDAQTEVVKVYRFPDLKDVSRHERRISLSFDGGVHFQFETGDPSLAEQLVQQVEQQRQRVSGHSGPPSSRELAALDPLADTGFRSPFTPTEPRRKSSPRWLRFGWLEAVIAGALIGPLLWTGRNLVSEERLYTAARNLDSAGAYQAYLERGGKRADVSEVLLPNAQLKQAIAKGSVAALEQYMARGKYDRIKDQVHAALKQALLNELSQVAAKGSLTALAAFERDQEHHDLVQAEIDARRKEIYQRAARSFAAVAQPTTPGLVGFFGRLLFYAQQHGPEVEIAFRRRMPETTKDAEGQLMRSAYYLGADSLPSKYLGLDSWEPRERVVGEEIAARLNKEFPPDILHFELAPVMPDDGSDFPKVKKPTLVITHRAEMSGAFMSKRPRGVFVALGVMIRAAFIVPGDDQPLNYKYSAWLPPDMKVWEQPGATPKDVYEHLGKEGLSRYAKKQLAFFLKAP